MRSSPSIAFLTLSLAVAGGLSARDAHADDDHFTLRLGAIQADGDARIKGAVDVGGETFGYTSDRLDFGDETVPRIEGIFRFSERNRLLFNYFRYDKDRDYVLGEDVDLGGPVIPAGSFARANAKFGIGSLVYDYAFIETPTVSFGAQIGAAWADVQGSINATAGEAIVAERESEHGVAPVVGLRLSTNSADQKWGFTVQGQYLNAEWGDFDDYSGDISRANALIEYRFMRHAGVYVGYDWFRLDVEHDFGIARGGVDLRFQGPTAGLTLAF